MGKITLNVPTMHVRTGFCLPGCLSTVISYWGKRIDPFDTANHLDPVPEVEGFYGSRAVGFARRLGFSSWKRDGYDIGGIERLLSRSVPPIVRINLYDDVTRGHYVVVRGIDTAADWLLLSDSTEGRRRIRIGEFVELWDADNRQGKSYNQVIGIRKR